MENNQEHDNLASFAAKNNLPSDLPHGLLLAIKARSSTTPEGLIKWESKREGDDIYDYLITRQTTQLGELPVARVAKHKGEGSGVIWDTFTGPVRDKDASWLRLWEMKRRYFMDSGRQLEDIVLQKRRYFLNASNKRELYDELVIEDTADPVSFSETLATIGPEWKPADINKTPYIARLSRRIQHTHSPVTYATMYYSATTSFGGFRDGSYVTCLQPLSHIYISAESHFGRAPSWLDISSRQTERIIDVVEYPFIHQAGRHYEIASGTFFGELLQNTKVRPRSASYLNIRQESAVLDSMNLPLSQMCCDIGFPEGGFIKLPGIITLRSKIPAAGVSFLS